MDELQNKINSNILKLKCCNNLIYVIFYNCALKIISLPSIVTRTAIVNYYFIHWIQYSDELRLL